MGIIARQAFWNTLLSLVGMALGFLNMALLFPRYLSPDEFGFTRLVVSIAVVGAQVAQLGAEATVIRYFPYFRDRSTAHRGFFGSAFLVATVGAALAMLVLALFHERFTVWFGDESGFYATYGRIAIPLLLAEVYFILLRGFGRAVQRTVAATFSREFLLRILQTGLIAWHALAGLEFRSFLLLYTGTFMLATLLVALDLWRAGELRLGLHRMRVPRRMRASMSRYAFFTLSSGLAVIVVGNVDQVMLGAMLKDGLSYVAFYAVALFMAGLVMVPARALILPTLPLMAEAWRKRDMAQLRMLYHRTAQVQLVLSLYLMIGIWACMDQLFSFLEPAYAAGKPVLLVLGVANVINLSAGLSAGLVSTSRAYWFDAVSGLAYLVLNLVLDYVFILWWGMMGAAWSSLVSLIIVLGWRLIFLYRRYGLWPYDRRTLLTLLVGGAAVAAVAALPAFASTASGLLVRGGTATLVFWAGAYVLGLAPDITALLRTLGARVGLRQ
mgnify:CR=1 FL=1